MPVEEVYKCTNPEGKKEWRGMHSGKVYTDAEVREDAPGIAFGEHYGGWNDPAFRGEKDKCKGDRD